MGKIMKIDDNQLEQLRLKAITAMDGVWFMAVEEKFGLEAAVEIDIQAWKNYGLAIFKRAARLLGRDIDQESPQDLRFIGFLFDTMCRVDGTECDISFKDDETFSFKILRCSWWENMERSGRVGLIPCEVVDNAIFAHYLEALNPALKIETAHSRPRGDDFCEWIITGSGC